MQNIRHPRGTRKPPAGTSELHARAAPKACRSGMAVRTPRAARHRPQRGRRTTHPHAVPPRHATWPDGPHGASRPHRAPRIPEIHPPAQAPSPAADRNASPAALVARGQPPATALASPGRHPAQRCTRNRNGYPTDHVRGRPWKADGVPDRATGPDAVRYTSVDTATHRRLVIHRDTWRDEKETAPRPHIRSQEAVSAGGGRCRVRTNVG